MKPQQIQKWILYQLFSEFIKEAEDLISRLEVIALDKNEDLSVYVESNSLFDNKLESLAIVTKHCPKLIIDSIMIWRSQRIPRGLDRLEEIQKRYPSIQDLETRIKKRNSLLANFVLVKALISIVMHLESLGDELGTKLEDMVFAQLRSAEPDQISRYVNLAANVTYFAKLMGSLSHLRFATITDRFISELRSVKGLDKQSEAKLELLIGCMRFLKLRLYPLANLEESADFLQALTDLFHNSHSIKIKIAFCELFLELLSDVQRIAGVEVNVPVWQKTIEQIVPKAMRMVTKGKHMVALQLMTTLLTVSKRDYFLKHWVPLTELLLSRIKEKRLVVCRCLCTLIYVYLFRCCETPSSVVQKRIDLIIRALFGKKKSCVKELVDVHSRTIYYILAKYPEYGMEQVKMLAIDAEDDGTRSDGSLLVDEVVNAEGIWIALKSFSMFLDDVEKMAKKDGFIGTLAQVKSSGTSILVEGKISLSPPPFPDFTQPVVVPNNEILANEIVNRLGVGICDTIELLNQSIGKALVILERSVCGRMIYSAEIRNISPATSLNGIPRRPSASVVDTLHSLTATQETDSIKSNSPSDPKGLLVALLCSLPRFKPTGISTQRIVEIISKCTLNADPVVRKTAFECIGRILKINDDNEAWLIDSKIPISKHILQVVIDCQFRLLVSHYREIWVHGDKLLLVLDELAEAVLELIYEWMDQLEKQGYTASEEEAVDTSIHLESLGLVLLLSPSTVQRVAGVAILKSVSNYRTLVLPNGGHKLQEDREGGEDSVGMNALDRLSTFHGGHKAAIYKRYSKRSQLEASFITLHEIMMDQGEQILREQHPDPLEWGSTSNDVSHIAKVLERGHSIAHIAQSKDISDILTWERCLPHLLQRFMKYGNASSIKKCLGIAWDFLKVMHPIISSMSNGTPVVQIKQPGNSKSKERGIRENAIGVFIEQWKCFLTFAYTVIEVAQPTKAFDPKCEPFSNMSASELHRNYLPLLGSERFEFRKAVVFAIGTLPPTSYRSLIGEIQNLISKIVMNSQRRLSSASDNARRVFNDPQFDRIRTEVTHLLSQMSDFTQNPDLRGQFSIMASISDYMRAMLTFFNDPEVSFDWKHQMTRHYFCIFVEKYYRMLADIVSRIPEETVEQYIPFKLRYDLFSIFELWSGFGIGSRKSIERDNVMVSMVLDSIKDPVEKQIWHTKLESQKRSIQIVALQAMASLCRGPLMHFSEPGIAIDTRTITACINHLLNSAESRMRNIARTCIRNILSCDVNFQTFFEEFIGNCYIHASSSPITGGYFLGLVDFLTTKENWEKQLPKVICIVLYHMSNENVLIRKAAGKLLLSLDERLRGSISSRGGLAEDVVGWYTDTSRSNDMEDDALTVNMDANDELSPGTHATCETTGLYSSLPMVYLAIREKVSSRIARAQPEVLSELFLRIISLHEKGNLDDCQGLLRIMGPFVSNFDVAGDFSFDVERKQVSEHKEAESLTCSVVNNLFALTVVFGSRFHVEIEDLWKSLVGLESGKPQRNVEVILDLLTLLVLSFKNSRTIFGLRLVIMALSRTECGHLIWETLLERITPSSLYQPISGDFSKEIAEKLIPSSKLYTVNFNDLGLANNSKYRLSPGFLMACSLVEISTERGPASLVHSLPLLLSVIFIHFDASLIQVEQMRLLLINLIHVILNEGDVKKDRIDATVAALNLKEGKRFWKFEHNVPGHDTETGSEEQLGALVSEILDLFTKKYSGLANDWAHTALLIAADCNDYHLSCRALQIYRKLFPGYTKGDISLLLCGLCKCVAGKEENYQVLSNEFLITLRKITSKLNPNQLMLDCTPVFWTSVALLSSPLEWEFLEGLKLISIIFKSIDPTDTKHIPKLFASLPTKWPEGFEGLLKLLCRGMCSKKSELLCLDIINSLLFVTSPHLLDNRPSRFLFVSLANAPRLLRIFNNPTKDTIEQNLKTADLLALAGSSSNCDSLARLFTMYANQKIATAEDFVKKVNHIIQKEYPTTQWEVISFCLNLLSNPLPHYAEFALIMLERLLQMLPEKKEVPSGESEFSESWLHSLINLLDTPFYQKSARVLDSVLTGRLKTSEADIVAALGGSHNMYNFAKRAKQRPSPTFSETGWQISPNHKDESDLVRKRVYAAYKSCEAVPVRHLYKPNQIPLKSEPPNHKINTEYLIEQFKELEIFFRNSMQQ